MIVTGMVDSYSVPTNARDVSAAFNLITRPETPLLNAVEQPYVAMNTSHHWWDDVRQAIQTTLTGAYTKDALVLPVAAITGIRVGSLLAVDNVLYRVASISSLNVTVVLLSSADTAHSSGAAVYLCGNAAKEGEDYEDTDWTGEVERENVTHILNDFAKIAGTQQAIKREVNNGDQLIRMIQAKLERLYLNLGRILWRGVLTTAASNSDRRVMGGVDYFIKTNGYAPAASAFSADNFDSFLLTLDQMGASIGEAWMNPAMLSYFAGLDSTKVQLQREDKTRGVYVDRYISKYGHEVELKTDINAATGKIYVFRTEQVKILPLAGRQMQVQDLAKTGDNDRKMIVGEYTSEFWNSAVAGYFTPSS
jgi:hypothetical protein